MQWKWWQLFIILILLSDLTYLNYFSFTKISVSVIPTPAPPTSVDQCGPICQKQIDTKITELKEKLPTPYPTQKRISTAKTKVRSVSYLPIPGNGSTSANDWASISGTDFYIDTTDYSGLVNIYLETNGHLFNGNGIAFIRLFDVTHGVGVQGSEVRTTNQADTALVSGQVSFYAGKNLIRVQAKSLTADTAIFTSGRLKITVEN